jgi:hypothetical protein
MANLLEEDALKIAFALESLDSPDPFAHEAVVPDTVKDAIKCDARDALCQHRVACICVALLTDGAMSARMPLSSASAKPSFAKSSSWGQR